MNFFTPEVIASLIGSFLAAIIALLSISINNHLHKKRAKKQEKEELKAYLIALKTEVSSLWNRYDKTISCEIRKEKKLSVPVAATQEYFTIFETSTNYLGKLKDDNLRIHIIDTYIHAKAMLDNISMNNYLCQKLEQHHLYALEALNKDQLNTHKYFAEYYESSLNKFGHILLEHDLELEKKIKTLIKRITETISTGEF